MSLKKRFLIYKIIFIIFLKICRASECGDFGSYHEEIQMECTNQTKSQDKSECREQDSDCYQWCDTEKVKINVTYSDLGNVTMLIPVSPPHCCHKSLCIQLLAIESPCANLSSSKNLDFPVHSLMVVDLVGCEEKSQEIVANFSYIFSGCYQLHIHPSVDEGTRQRCETQFDIKTNYKKKLLSDANITYARSYSAERTELYLKINGGGVELPKIKNNLRLCNVTYGGEEISQKLGKTYHTSDRCSCSHETDIFNCKSNEKQRNCSCEWKDNTIDCTFSNVKDGNYCLEVEFEDIRCSQHTLWVTSDSGCTWSTNFSFTAPKDSPKIRYRSNNTYQGHIHWILIGLLGVFVGMLGTLFYCKRKTHRHRDFQLLSQTPKLPHETPSQILLLYPRDCDLFMAAMSKFRQLLSNKLNVKVLDIWDPDEYETVVENEYIWVIGHISNPDTKIILVASKCSRLIDRAVLEGHEIKYLAPKSLDSAFKLAITTLHPAAIIERNSYKKIYIVRFDGINYEEDRFRYVNPCTVYTIPQNLHGLLSDLKGSETEFTQSLRGNFFSTLTSALDDFNKYKMNNPDYLDQIIEISTKIN